MTKKDFVFLSKGIFTINDGKGKAVKFKLNKSQQLVLDRIFADLESKGKSKIIVIKGRQLGITTFCQLLGLALIMIIKGFQCYTMVHDSSIATDIFETKVKRAFNQLPDELKGYYDVNRNNTRQLMFNNRDKASLTVGLSGRGGTYQFKHISEAGKMSMNQGLWEEMIEGTLEAGDSIIEIIESTPDGGLGKFYDYVQTNIDNVIFLRWTLEERYQMTPQKDDKWIEEYKEMAQKYELYPDPMTTEGLTKEQFFWYYNKAKTMKAKVKVQYPLSLDEAFVSSSKTRFFIQDVIAAKKTAKVPFKINSQGVKFYHEVKDAYHYALGVDPATGVGNDNSTISIWCFETGKQVASWAGKESPATVAWLAMKLGQLYNLAIIGVEVNGVGLATEQVVQENYPKERQYRRAKKDKTNPVGPKILLYGWETTGQTRPVMIDEYAESYENGELEVNDLDELQEMLTFVQKTNGRYEHEDMKHDDRIFASMIAVQIFKFIATH
jgi:Terminase RNaseH-like domain